MADSVVQSNNKLSAPNRKSPQMPSVSKAQNAAMHAAAAGKSTIGIPQSVGKEFSDAQAPGSVKKLPERVSADNRKVGDMAKSRASQMLKRGLISEKEHAKITGKADKVLGSSKSKASGDTEASGASDTAAKDDPPAVKPRGTDQVDVKVKPGMASWST